MVDSAEVKATARRLGFQLVGITTPDPPPHLAVYQAWLEAGRHGEMAYLASERARQRRADPRLILPECRSILVLGLRYAKPPDLKSPDTTGSGQAEAGAGVAAYAWGQDYHRVFAERLARLIATIEAELGRALPNRWYSDTGPILERELAQRAGLGWIGKNTCLINPQQGSYFLLGEVLLGLELAPDPPFDTDRCGSCTRCLEACPTACILPDRTIDASRCLSYLTIELKGGIPIDLRPQLGGWVFGCDVCQQVCPWNRRFAAPQGDPALATQPGLLELGLASELGLTQEGFSRKFKGSPLKRAKRRGYLRNVAVALGNYLTGPKTRLAATKGAIRALIQALLEDPEPLVRGHAAWALGRSRRLQARQALQRAADDETDETVLAEIRLALEGFQDYRFGAEKEQGTNTSGCVD